MKTAVLIITIVGIIILIFFWFHQIWDMKKQSQEYSAGYNEANRAIKAHGVLLTHAHYMKYWKPYPCSFSEGYANAIQAHMKEQQK